jgi:hypothetical protein
MEALHRLAAALRAGPPGARVDSVVHVRVDEEPELARPFAIAR